MAESTVVKVRRDGTITLKDGGGNTYVVAYENGDLSFDGGTIVGLRKGDDPVPSMSFTVMMRDFQASSGGSLIDFLDKTGGASGATSTGGVGYEQYLIDIQFDAEGTAHGDSNDHRATAAKALCTWSFSEGDPDTISVSAAIYGGITSSEPT